MKQIRESRRTIHFVAIILLVGSITFAGFSLHINSFIAGFVYLLPVLLIAFFWGFWEATLASVLCVLCLDYFFTDPVFALYMADPRDWVAISAFETVALLVSKLAMQAKSRAADAEEQRTRLEKLYRISRDALLFDQPEDCGAQLVAIAREVLQADGVALWDAAEDKICISGQVAVETKELRATYERSVDEDDAARGLWKRAVCLGQKPVGVLCVAGIKIDLPILDSIASLAAIAMERARSFEEKSTAEAARQSEQLRTAVLDALAHAFKTPLTTIRSASSGLLEIDGLHGSQKELVELIDQEAGRLADLTARLLTTAKLDGSTLKLRREQVQLTEIVEKCSHECSSALTRHDLYIRDIPKQKKVWADPQLVKLALNQMLDNAAKYSSPASRISLVFHENAVETVIGVHNEGSFIPSEERHQIFTRFYRTPGAEHKAPGTGIGLAVTKRIAEAHGGTAWVESEPGSGTTFFLSLPQGPKGE
ncbi:two-component system sensor histidine kinase KdpD [Silvibacterium bohemicum]|uniref:histidine kinase n=1 Tax=Silvibacterium bohemicum TaxID=1577686 RepID=A0A841JVY3_9BACT|nr:ATP-binding protein [Silvibacterium bohemicum]MBB6145563.1 two-component system sensor histidine kinase KdpD [Silvibacterium bohemicum]